MLEVFIAFTREHNLDDLEKTLEAWEKPGLEPVAIEVKPNKFELHRRVTAENLAAGNYVVAGVGTGPVEENFGELAEQALTDNPKVGLIKPACAVSEWVSGRVSICRKGIITHWIQPQGSQEADVLWASAHEKAYRHVGYEVLDCRTIHYRPLVVYSPC